MKAEIESRCRRHSRGQRGVLFLLTRLNVGFVLVPCLVLSTYYTAGKYSGPVFPSPHVLKKVKFCPTCEQAFGSATHFASENDIDLTDDVPPWSTG